MIINMIIINCYYINMVVIGYVVRYLGQNGGHQLEVVVNEC